MRALLVAFDPSESAAIAGFGKALGVPCDLLLLSGEPDSGYGAESAKAARLTELPPADALAAGLAEACSGYSHIAAVTSMRAKDVLARLAGLIGAAMVTDAVSAESPTVFKRPIVAGSLVATVEALASPLVLTVRPAGFEPASPAEAAFEAISLHCEGKARRIESSEGGGSRPELTQAKVVVSGGRPLKDAETFERLIGGLADALGGAVGATRAAVDSGIAPNELQVGQTGKIVAPDLYIAAGISGSTQHMAGIKDSKLIVAINTDPNAPIFEHADYGLVMDLYQAIPEMLEALKR